MQKCKLTLIRSAWWMVVWSIRWCSVLCYYRHIIFIFHLTVKRCCRAYNASVTINTELLIVDTDLFDPIWNLPTTLTVCNGCNYLALIMSSYTNLIHISIWFTSDRSTSYRFVTSQRTTVTRVWQLIFTISLNLYKNFLIVHCNYYLQYNEFQTICRTFLPK